MVEMMVSIPLMVVVVAQGGVGGRNSDGVGFLWRRKKEEEAKEENLQREREEGWFFGLLWTRFSPPSCHELHLYL
jgi:hypothetical protein